MIAYLFGRNTAHIGKLPVDMAALGGTPRISGASSLRRAMGECMAILEAAFNELYRLAGFGLVDSIDSLNGLGIRVADGGAARCWSHRRRSGP